MRDDSWLHGRLDHIWDHYFGDVAQDNIVRIVWGRKARTRLGSIRLDPKDPTVTIITINSLYKDEFVPDFVIDATIVHELSHYAHGFNSPHAQTKQHPHAGGVMAREFAERGLTDMYRAQKRWLKAHWAGFVEQHLPSRHRTRRSSNVPTIWWLR